MKRLYIIMIRLVVVISIMAATGQNSFSQVFGDIDSKIHATDSLETDGVFMYHDTIIPVLDIAYWEWSADGVTFRKNYVANDTWARYSGYTKFDWDTIRFALNLWEVSGDTIKPINETIIYGDTLVSGTIVSNVYFLGGDTLSHQNMYNGGDASDGYVLIYRGDTARWEAPATGFGETNIMQNAGTRGVGVYDNKTDTLFNMRNIASLTSLLTVTLDAADSVIDLDLALKTITAGIGLSGGGTMENDITLNIYIPELTTLTDAIDYDNDYFIVYDASSATHKKTTLDELSGIDLYIEDALTEVDISQVNFRAGYGLDVSNSALHTVEYEADTTELATQYDLSLITSCSQTVQTLVSTLDTLNVSDGIHGSLDIGANTQIRIEPTAGCNTGNITVICDVTGYTIEFTSDYTIQVAPCLSATTKVITTTASAGALDVYSYWFDGTYIFINGTKNYE